MVEQKDFATLIAAFAQLVQQRDARLIILGDGPLRGELVAMAEAAGVSNKLDMPGFHENPLSFMREADALVMSSRFEGFGIVIAEALACGTPVVSTDCQHGPNEILENGHYGALVPVGDPQAMRQAMLTILETHPSAEELIRRGNEFSVERCAGKYLDLFRKLLRQ